MCFHCGSITEQNSTILQTERDKGRETQTVTEIVRNRQRQIQDSRDRQIQK